MKKTIESIFEEADFSKESNHRNLLFYELFQKPVPVPEGPHGKVELNFESLGAIAGGKQERTSYEAFRPIVISLLKSVDEDALKQLYTQFLAANEIRPVSVETFLRSANLLK